MVAWCISPHQRHGGLFISLTEGTTLVLWMSSNSVASSPMLVDMEILASKMPTNRADGTQTQICRSLLVLIAVVCFANVSGGVFLSSLMAYNFPKDASDTHNGHADVVRVLTTPTQRRT
jgi:hypothetical protein